MADSMQKNTEQYYKAFNHVYRRSYGQHMTHHILNILSEKPTG